MTIPQQDNARRKGVRKSTNVAPALHSRFQRQDALAAEP
jgi:hypothetical protein